MFRALRIAVLFVVALGVLPAWAQERAVALVIGQSAYTRLTPLPNASSDARDIYDLLAQMGFETTPATDLDHTRLTRAIERFVEDAEGADIALVYYAGHGIEANGENYLVPTDANLTAPGNAAGTLIATSPLLRELATKVRVTIVMLDACRTNPFPAGALLQSPGAAPAAILPAGLGAPKGEILSAPDIRTDSLGLLIALAAAPGQPAYDGLVGENSPFTAALLRHLGAMSGEEITRVLRLVGAEVFLNTNGRQQPWINIGLGDVAIRFGRAPEGPEGDAADILSERRQLLATMTTLAEDQRRQVAAIATAEEVPISALFSLLRSDVLDRVQVAALGDDAALNDLLRSQAARLRDVLGERRALPLGDAEVTRLAALADEAFAEGALDKARELYEAAKQRIEETDPELDASEEAFRNERIRRAEIFARAAAALEFEFDFLGAAADYRRAAEETQIYEPALSRTYLVRSAAALTEAGYWSRNVAQLTEAVDALRTVIAATPEADERDWAEAHARLAKTLADLGNLTGRYEFRTESIEVYRIALAHTDRATDPRKWAELQWGLSFALQDLGHARNSPSLLEEAVAAARASLEERRKEDDPVAWAASHNAIGNTLFEMGSLTNDLPLLEEALIAYERALTVRTRETYPILWAASTSNTGLVLRAMGRISREASHYERAEAAFVAASEVYSREAQPRRWGNLHRLLGDLYRDRAWIDGDPQWLSRAVESYSAAADVFRPEQPSADFGFAQNGIGLASVELYRWTEESAVLLTAASAFRAVIANRPDDRLGRFTLAAHERLADALLNYGRAIEDGTWITAGLRAMETWVQLTEEGGDELAAALARQRLAEERERTGAL